MFPWFAKQPSCLLENVWPTFWSSYYVIIKFKYQTILVVFTLLFIFVIIKTLKLQNILNWCKIMVVLLAWNKNLLLDGKNSPIKSKVSFLISKQRIRNSCNPMMIWKKWISKQISTSLITTKMQNVRKSNNTNKIGKREWKRLLL